MRSDRRLSYTRFTLLSFQRTKSPRLSCFLIIDSALVSSSLHRTLIGTTLRRNKKQRYRARAVKSVEHFPLSPTIVYRQRTACFSAFAHPSPNLLHPSHFTTHLNSTPQLSQLINLYHRIFGSESLRRVTSKRQQTSPEPTRPRTRPHDEVLPADSRLRLHMGRGLDEQLAQIRSLEREDTSRHRCRHIKPLRRPINRNCK